MTKAILEKLTDLDPTHFKKSHDGRIYFEAPRIQYQIVKDSEGNVDEFMLGAVSWWCLEQLPKATTIEVDWEDRGYICMVRTDDFLGDDGGYLRGFFANGKTRAEAVLGAYLKWREASK